MEQEQSFGTGTGAESASGSSTFEDAKDKGRDAAQQASQQASSTVRTQVDERSTQAGQQISTQAGDIRTVAEKLREEGKEAPAKVADQAAQQIERVGSYLEQSNSDRILGDVEDYARSNPWAVAAGGLAVGFLAARFLGASSKNRPSSSGSSSPSYGSAGYDAGQPQHSLVSGTPTDNGLEPATQPARTGVGEQAPATSTPPATPQTTPRTVGV